MCRERLQQDHCAAVSGSYTAVFPLVLIVDDDADARAIYVEILQSRGFRTIEAGDGEVAIELAAQARPDVILMDGSMPGLSGQEVAIRLRADLRTHEIPIVILSGSIPPPQRSRSAPWDAYITKPSSADDIVTTLHSVLPTAKRETLNAKSE